MKLQYLGTAAAEGIPALYCECDVCKTARKMGGKFIRTRSQALVDDCLLIDYPADTYMHFIQHNVPMPSIKTVLITHAHADHLYPNDLMAIKPGYSHIKNQNQIHIYADQRGYDLIEDAIKRYSIPQEVLFSHKIKLYTSFVNNGYTVTAYRASHSQATSPVVYAIEKGGKSLFYAHDTSDFTEDVWAELQKRKTAFNLVSLDCTEACNKSDYVGHMDLNRCEDMRKKLIRYGLANDKTIFVLNHFSHNGKHVSYDEFTKCAAKKDFLVSYDGMTIEI